MSSVEDQSETIATEEARRLFEEGLSLIPLGSPGDPVPPWFRQRCASDEDAADKWPKTPRVKWAQYQRQQPSEAEFESWCRNYPRANWAILTGHRINVVDADSAEAVAFVESGAITRSPRKVVTAKGAHYYYRADERVAVKNSTNPHTKIDIRGAGGYVVAPGSVHATGAVYTEELLSGWGDTSWSELPALTAEDLKAINRFNGLELQEDGRFMPGNLNFDATKVKPTADGSPVVEGGRNNAAASLTGQLITAGTDARAIKQMLDAWNAENLVPLPQDELNRTVASVMQTHLRNHPDQPIPAVPGLDVAHEQAKVIPGLQPFDLADLEHRTPEPVGWVWEGWIPKRYASGVFAEGGTGKSLAMLQLAICRAAQIPYIDGKVPPPGRTLLLFCEDDQDIITLRAHKLMARYHLSWDQIKGQVAVLCRVGENNYLMTFNNKDVGSPTPFWYQIRDLISEFRPDLFVVDTRSDVFPGKEIDPGQARQFVQRALTALAQEFDLAAVFLAHVSVSGKASGSGLSGTNAWRDTARSQIYLRKERPKAPKITVELMKSNHSASGTELEIFNDAGYLMPFADIDLSVQIDQAAKQDFLSILQRQKDQEQYVSLDKRTKDYAPLEFARISKALKKWQTTDAADFEKAMEQLIEDGTVVRWKDPRDKVKHRAWLPEWTEKNSNET